METPPAYTLQEPTLSELMDCIRDNARNLSDAIVSANQHGLNVRIEKAPEGSQSLIQIIYTV